MKLPIGVSCMAQVSRVMFERADGRVHLRFSDPSNREYHAADQKDRSDRSAD
jgi:hypothetical protein